MHHPCERFKVKLFHPSIHALARCFGCQNAVQSVFRAPAQNSRPDHDQHSKRSPEFPISDHLHNQIRSIIPFLFFIFFLPYLSQPQQNPPPSPIPRGWGEKRGRETLFLTPTPTSLFLFLFSSPPKQPAQQPATNPPDDDPGNDDDADNLDDGDPIALPRRPRQPGRRPPDRRRHVREGFGRVADEHVRARALSVDLLGQGTEAVGFRRQVREEDVVLSKTMDFVFGAGLIRVKKKGGGVGARSEKERRKT